MDEESNQKAGLSHIEALRREALGEVEVDAALDNTNVAKVARYIQAQASDAFQFIVISLKTSFYEKSHSLVGIHRDQDVNSSKSLTLDVSFIAQLLSSKLKRCSPAAHLI